MRLYFHKVKSKICILTVLAALLFAVSCSQEKNGRSLEFSQFEQYVNRFNNNDNELYAQFIPNNSAISFLSKHIPLIEVPDKVIEETYYFRWWTYRKHIKKTPDGFVITEFLPNVPWSGKYNTINCPAGHHIYEGRWLRNSRFISDYIDFWLLHSDEGIRQYSFWIADAVLSFHKIHSNVVNLENRLPLLVSNYEAWEQKRRDAGKSLFWQVDSQEGMEVSVSGRVLNDGIPVGAMEAIRPSMNSYMYGDAMAIAAAGNITGADSIATKFTEKAFALKRAVQSRLWNEKLDFFTVLPRNYDNKTQPIDVREAIGFVPWYFNLPDDANRYGLAWNKVMDTTAFYAPFGLTVCERSHPYFTVSYSGHECQWNGPSWPFATTQTLKAMSNLLNYYSHNGNITNEDYFKLLLQYAASHSIITQNGGQQMWIDENLNPFTGDWISRTRLKTWTDGTWSAEKGGVERGKDYNHSGFCDLVISDLLGLKPRVDNIIEINPLVPDDWEWFCLDRVLYHGRELTIIWDKTGNKYHQGKGLLLFSNSSLKAQSPGIQRLLYNPE